MATEGDILINTGGCCVRDSHKKGAPHKKGIRAMSKRGIFHFFKNPNN